MNNILWIVWEGANLFADKIECSFTKMGPNFVSLLWPRIMQTVSPLVTEVVLLDNRMTRPLASPV